jgi:restriction endonuclease Mrr
LVPAIRTPVVTLLDDLSGFEFEDAVVSLFRAHGYGNVQAGTRVADEGRDITMYDGDTAYVVECKHTDTVSRPVVQKLHSAIATFDHDGPKRGMVVTSGRFTGPAEEYADRLRTRGDPHPIDLIDGRELRELGEAVGMDLYNGRIEIICEETLPVGDPETVFVDVFEDVANAPSRADLPTPDYDVRYRPVVDVEAVTRATFETSVGVIHRIDRRDHLAVEADGSAPRLATDLVDLTGVETVDLDPVQRRHSGEADRFQHTEREYREWATDRLCDLLETTVTYTGDNNVTYHKDCRPSPKDVAVRRADPLYIPRIDAGVALGEYTHNLEYAAAGNRYVTREDGIRRCVHCDTAGHEAAEYTYCENCGSISCEAHTEEERLTGEPVCTGCAVTGEFFFATKYFFHEGNRETFREEYEAMPFYRKPLENPHLAAGVAVALMLVLLVLVGAFV